MVSLFLLLGCNLSYIVVLFAALHELASASERTLLKLASSVRALLKPYGDTLRWLNRVLRARALMSSFNSRLKVLISEVTVEQQILALVCYVSVALIRKIAKRTRILTFD